MTSADPGSSAGAQLAEPPRPVAGDQRQVSERLDVLDEASEAGARRARTAAGRRSATREARVDEIDQRALLPGEVPLRGRDQRQSRLAGSSRAGPLAERALEAANAARVGLGHRDDRFAGVDRAGGDARRRRAPDAAALAAAHGPSCSPARPRRRWPARSSGPRRDATARSFCATGNDAPPWPRSPADSTSSISSTRREPTQVGERPVKVQVRVELRGRRLADAEQQAGEQRVVVGLAGHGVALTVPEAAPLRGSILSCATRLSAVTGRVGDAGARCRCPGARSPGRGTGRDSTGCRASRRSSSSGSRRRRSPGPRRRIAQRAQLLPGERQRDVDGRPAHPAAEPCCDGAGRPGR